MQDVFIIPDGGPGALAELERRKFTAEEGVSIQRSFSINVLTISQDHLTLLNGEPCNVSDGSKLITLSAYNAFTRYGRSSGWCKSHALSFRAMSRAVSIRSQLKKYMQRFHLPLESCEGDAKRLRRCLVSGYWRNGARWVADGTYRSVRGNQVRYILHPIFHDLALARRLCMCIRHPSFLQGSQNQDGSSFMKWKKQKRHSEWFPILH